MKSNTNSPILKINFYIDFLFFLGEVESRGLELTQTGNLKLKEINYFGKNFKKDIYHRDDDGTIMFAIRSEEEVYYLQRIRQIASVANFVYKRKGKLKISKNGKIFLNLKPYDQYSQLIWEYCNRCNWAFDYYSLNENFVPIPEIIQKNQAIIWDYCLKTNNWLDFKILYDLLKKNLFPDYQEEYQTLHYEIEKTVITDFEMLVIFEVKRVKSKYYGEDIDKFRLTKIGREMIEKITKSLEFENASEIMNKNTLLPQIKFKYFNFKEEGEKPTVRGTICAHCRKHDIVIGGGIDAHTKNPKTICEDCAINRYMQEENFSDKEIAKSHRRRFFDIPYLLCDVVLDKYLALNNIKGIDAIDENTYNLIITTAGDLWNKKFTKEEKIRLQKTVDQKEIEKNLKKALEQI